MKQDVTKEVCLKNKVCKFWSVHTI